jgi:hypothetical protein
MALAEETARATDDQRLLARALHAMAYVLVTRGELDGAMGLYQQSLATHEALGDVQGKGATLHQMAGVLVTGDLDGRWGSSSSRRDQGGAGGRAGRARRW